MIHEISGTDFFGNEKSKFHKSERRSRSARSSQAKFAHSWSAARICEITISWELMALGAQRLPWKHDVTPSAATVGYLRPEEGFRSFDSAKNRLHRGSFIRFFLADTAALPTTVVHLLTPRSTPREETSSSCDCSWRQPGSRRTRPRSCGHRLVRRRTIVGMFMS